MKLLGNGSTEQEKSAPKIPRWLFRIIQFLFSLSPRLEKELSIFIEDIILSTIHLWSMLKKLLRWSAWTTKVLLVIILLYLLWTIVPAVEIPWYVIVGPPLLSIIVLTVVLAFRKKTSTPEETTSTPKSPPRTGFLTPGGWFDRWVIKGRAIPIIGAVILGHILLLNSEWGEWARAHAYTPQALLVQLAFGYGLWLLDQNPKSKPLKHRVGVLLIWCSIIFLGNKIRIYTMEHWGGSLPSTQASSTSVPGQSIWVRGTATPPTERFDEECKARASILNKEMREKIKVDFKDHPLMIPIACRESGYNQTKWGTTEVLKGEKDPNDHGVFQINLTHHAAEIKRLGLDVDKYEGQVAYVRYLLSTPQGIDHWFPKESGQWYAPITTVVPVTKDWSPLIEIPLLTKKVSFDIKNKQKILAEIDGKEVVMDPNNPKEWGDFDKIRFKTIEGSDDTIVTIPMEFHPVP